MLHFCIFTKFLVLLELIVIKPPVNLLFRSLKEFKDILIELLQL